MRLIHTVLACLFVICAAGFVLGQDPAKPSATWQVQKYDIDVTLPADGSRSIPIRARLSLKNISPRPASSLTLRISPTAEITTVRLNDADSDFSKNEEKINSGVSLQRVSLRPGPIIAGGVLAVAVEYRLNIKENGGAASLTQGGAHLLPSSYWYPTPNSWFFTQGPDRAPTRIKVNFSAGLSIASSGMASAGAFDDRLLVQPFFVAGDWGVTTLNGVSVLAPKGTGPEGQKRGDEMTALFSEARSFMSGFLGKAPDAPLRIVSTRRGAGFSGGGTLLVDEAAFRRSAVDSTTAMNIAEAAARLWLGNSVSVAGDGYGVISEGMVRYLATQFIENKFGKDIADIERLRQRTSYAGVSKRDMPMSTVSPLDDYYYPEVANKGAMMWRILARRLGADEFWSTVRANMQDGELNVADLRTAFVSQKPLLDVLFDQVTEMNLLVGLPQATGSDTKVAVRNTGTMDATVDVAAFTAAGGKIVSPTTIRATSFGEVIFRSAEKIIRVEIDAEKLYPQTDYSDDVAPRESTDGDPLLAVKRLFDKQEYANAEATARTMLRELPRSDDLRVLLGRALLAQNKNTEAEREFRAVLNEKLPAARSLAWANVGLGEVATRSNQNAAALRYCETAIVTDSDYGASLAARNIRRRLGGGGPVAAAVKQFFVDFDKAVSGNRKAEVEAMVGPGEVTRFSSGVSGSTERWLTQVSHVDQLDPSTLLVEANMNIKLLNRNEETGLAVFRLVNSGGAWKLVAVDIFEVR
ncbi:MAG: tetratricopeptide repeat protein [Chloracidobacterium sp.]|nr:tetratricopeptide repeat protein [Chloracidobacterium sp.]